LKEVYVVVAYVLERFLLILAYVFFRLQIEEDGIDIFTVSVFPLVFNHWGFDIFR